MLCWVGSRLPTSARTVLIFDYALPMLYQHIYLCFTSISLPPQQAFAGVVTVIAVLVSILLATVTSSLSKKFNCGRVSFFCACCIYAFEFICNLVRLWPAGAWSEMALEMEMQGHTERAQVPAKALILGKLSKLGVWSINFLSNLQQRQPELYLL